MAWGQKTFMCWTNGQFLHLMKLVLGNMMTYGTRNPDVVFVNQDPTNMRSYFPKNATIIWVVKTDALIAEAEKCIDVDAVVSASSETLLEDIKKAVWPLYALLFTQRVK